MNRYLPRTWLALAGAIVFGLVVLWFAGWWAGQATASERQWREWTAAVGGLSPVVAALTAAGLMGLVLMVALPGSRTPRMAWLAPLSLLMGLAVIVGVTAWLMGEADSLPEPDRSVARIDAIRTGLSTGAGVGGAVALMLAFRRQRYQESAAEQEHAHNLATAEEARKDATERRAMELYVKAMEQIGSDQATIRLGGLYALERLAREYHDYRETVVKVVCAYLRQRPSFYDKIKDSGLLLGLDPEEHDEVTVRYAAQSIIAENTSRTSVRPHIEMEVWNPRTQYSWGRLHIDLSGAVLLNLRLPYAHLTSVSFEGAEFFGTSVFDESVFGSNELPSYVSFLAAVFRGPVSFRSARFVAGVTFELAEFTSEADFKRAGFDGVPKTPWASEIIANFEAAEFGDVDFGIANFRCPASFDYARFAGEFEIAGARFIKVSLDQTSFGDSDVPTMPQLKSALDAATFVSSPILRTVSFVPSEDEELEGAISRIRRITAKPARLWRAVTQHRFTWP